ncbi:hypothetical protein [Streptomyces sp. NPDC058108]|uniref:hypothetical protein n=1 Tax=Streptomyces sp. NPDC058108 TaxID=3346344 RepID=UPI0036E13D14
MRNDDDRQRPALTTGLVSAQIADHAHRADPYPLSAKHFTLLEDSPPYRADAVLRGPRHLPVAIGGLTD